MSINLGNNQNWLIHTSSLASCLKKINQNAEQTLKSTGKFPKQNGQLLFYSGKRKYKENYFNLGTEIYNPKKENDDEELLGIAVLNLRGTLFKESYFDWYSCQWVEGTQIINEKLHLLGNDPEVLGVMIKVDSSGGAANGAETLANTIYNFKSNYKKPIWAYIDGSAYSAAYKIIAGCDMIILSGESSSVGSIGTMVQFYDDKKYLENLGIEPVEIYATLSKNKNKAWRDMQDGKTLEIIKELDKLNNIFINHVVKSRGAKMGIPSQATDYNVDNAPEQITGQTYMGNEAIQAGLADEIATEEYTLAKMFKKLDKTKNTESIFALSFPIIL